MRDIDDAFENVRSPQDDNDMRFATLERDSQNTAVLLRDMARRIERLELGHKEVSESQRVIIRSLQENTDVTTQVRDILDTGKALFTAARFLGRVIKFFAPIAGFFLTVYGFVYASMHGGKIP